MTSSLIVPKKSRSCAVRVTRQNTATAVPRMPLSPTSCPALRAASSGRFAPRCWLVTTAPPVASAPNTVMISWLIISTSDTPEIAASPTEETMTVSAMPTRTPSACSMISGQSSASSCWFVNSRSFFTLYNISLSQYEYSTKKSPAQCAGAGFTRTAGPRWDQALRPCWRDSSRRIRRWPY